jgi:hypothetical protein
MAHNRWQSSAVSNASKIKKQHFEGRVSVETAEGSRSKDSAKTREPKA